MFEATPMRSFFDVLPKKRTVLLLGKQERKDLLLYALRWRVVLLV
jgi:hypothetical protein